MPATVCLDPPPLAHAALRYAEQGMAVLPCRPGDKPPLWGLGWEDATTDAEQVEDWWSREPRANIGIACVGGFVALDVDGPEGRATLQDLEARNGVVGDTYRVQSGRADGGEHLWFRRPAGLADGWRHGGLELKASGYVLGPPSVHPSGAIYFALNGAGTLMLPAFLIRSPKPVPERVAPASQPSDQDPMRLAAAGAAALAGELEKLAGHSTEPETKRHTALFAAAAALGAHVAAGSLAETVVRSALERAAAVLQLPDDAETRRQIDSGLAKGAREPYRLTEREQVRSGGPADGGRVAVLRSVEEVQMRAVEWLWDQRIPLGKLSVLAGLAGQGKSQLTCALAGQLSLGTLPGALKGKPADVLIISAEDDPEDTIKPRLVVVGADLHRVHLLDMRSYFHGRPVNSTIELPGDALAVLEAIERTRARLVVLDPVSALLDANHSAYKNQEVRRGLAPIKAAAEQTRCAVVMVQHLLTKAQPGTEALARLADSHAFSGLPRAVWFLSPHPDDEEGDRGSRKLLTSPKGNLLAPGHHGVEIKIEGRDAGRDAEGRGVPTSRAVIGATVDLRTEDALDSSEERSERYSAERFLREHLAEREDYATVVQDLAEREGYRPKTVRNARERVGYHRKGAGNRSIWGLRDRPKPDSLVPPPTRPRNV